MNITAIRSQFNKLGYACFPLLPKRTLDLLEGRISTLMTQFQRQAREDYVRFDPIDQSHLKDPRFAASARQIVAIREKESDAINKIGHNILSDPSFSEVWHDPNLHRVLQHCGLSKPRCIQSMLNLKPADSAELPLHQDRTFLWDDKESLVGVWIALTAASQANGCLYVVPHSHRGDLIARQRVDQAGNASWEELAPLPSRVKKVSLEVPAGHCVLLHNRLLHGSHPNVTTVARPALALHCIEAGASLVDCWIPKD